MNLLPQSAANINAMEDLDVIKRNFETKMLSNAKCQDTFAIVCHYLQGVSPTLASTLIAIYPEVDTSCNFTLQEVLQAWKTKEVMEERALGVSKFRDKVKKKFNPIEGGGRINDDTSKIKAAKEISKKSKSDIVNSVAQSVVKVEMKEENVKKTTLETKVSSTTAMCLDTVSIVYKYLQRVNPTIASLLLEKHPEVMDFPCNITLEEVVLWHLAKLTDEKRGDGVSQLRVKVKEKVGININTIEGRKRKADHTFTIHEKVMIKDGSISTSITEADIENVGSTKGVNDSVGAKKTPLKKSLRARRAFTPREDAIIRNKLEEIGDDLNIDELAEEIGRNYGSVWNRVNKLKTGEAGRKPKSFSLAEDEAIMEKVLPGLRENKLHELVLHIDRSLQDLATALGRPNKANSLCIRWARQLQPWIMQHYAGTLNLDIRMMLMNHLAETYLSRESINWNAVASKTEFAGNTTINLKHTFDQVLKFARKSLNTESSWEQVIGKCKEHISQSKRCNSKKSELRRVQVIQYFENYVAKQEIENFL